MKAVGIVVEYNPFHNGHLYHVQQTRKKTNADCVIAVMSSSFTQRGEPAIVPKWERARMALAGGVDLVVELPYSFAVQTAERFAHGAVSILDALFCEQLCFGSEHGSIEPFIKTAQLLIYKKEQHNEKVKQYVRQGINYAKAYALALHDIGHDTLDVSQPNNILGLHYVKAMIEQRSNIKPETIQRIVAHYHDQTLPANQSIASATSIRRFLQSDHDDVARYVPHTTYDTLQTYRHTYTTWHDWEKYFPLLKYRLLTMNVDDIQQIAEVEEGIEYRLKKAIIHATSFHDFLLAVKTKRYTWTRLQRICTHILTNVTKKEMEKAHENKDATYVRPLAMNETGRAYLQAVKKQMALPLVTSVKQMRHDAIYHIEKKATQAYVSILPEPLWTEALQREYKTPPLR
ncbi:putative nucleotidyltransferase [Anoxybacillus mongoliensis]|uniref:tRNA(Met) cytidine acetate ligase n=1 Tax=Anoxybacillus mongoliensis TaxID=452565 RepID=A0A7W8N6F5_9BACL|nr:nucleotidyltransferase [Anoxybacillus mongoliensis]MBB5354991.1 putative nucleotidyltransferase [Anoxybacillus mongoliensis]